MTTNDGSAQPDLLTRVLPAISSTSDMPDVAETVVVPTPAISDSNAGLKPEAAVVETPPVAPEKKKQTMQERMGELTADKKEALARAEASEAARIAQEARADELDKSLRDVLARVDKVLPKPEEAMRPKRAEFDDPDKYDAALEAYAKDQGAKIAKAEAEAAFAKQRDEDTAKAEGERIAAENHKVAKEYVERSTKFKETAADYDDVVLGKDEEGNDKPFTTAMAALISSETDGPAIAYYLGKNVAELKRIAALPVAKQFLELGKISVKLAEPPKTTQTPPPITPIVTSRNAATSKTPEQESTEEYVTRRTKELRAEKARR